MKPPRRNVAILTELADILSVTSAKLSLLFTFTQDTPAKRLHATPSHFFLRLIEETVQRYVTAVCYIIIINIIIIMLQRKKVYIETPVLLLGRSC